MTRPVHADEHEAIAQMVLKSIRPVVPSSRVVMFVLVTIGDDGMPCAAGNADSQADIAYILARMAEQIANGKGEARPLPKPTSN